MNYARIESGICNTNIPTVGTLKNGNTVSGYDKLSREELLVEGWKELVENKPEVGEGQNLQFSGYEENELSIIANYIVVNIPIVEEPLIEFTPNEELLVAYEAIAMLEERLSALESKEE